MNNTCTGTPTIYLYKGVHSWQGRFENDPEHRILYDYDTIPLAYSVSSPQWMIFEELKDLYPNHIIFFAEE